MFKFLGKITCRNNQRGANGFYLGTKYAAVRSNCIERHGSRNERRSCIAIEQRGKRARRNQVIRIAKADPITSGSVYSHVSRIGNTCMLNFDQVHSGVLSIRRCNKLLRAICRSVIHDDKLDRNIELLKNGIDRATYRLLGVVCRNYDAHKGAFRHDLVPKRVK